MKAAKLDYKKLLIRLFDEMDFNKSGVLNLENIKKLYMCLSSDHRNLVRDKLRKFVIDNQKFLITKEEFLNLFNKNKTPYVHINLSHLKETQRIRELSQSELRNVIAKRKETKEVTNFKPRFIIKMKSSKNLDGDQSGDTKLKNNDLVHIRRAYFSSIS
jgi:hypothetical protein